MAQALKKSNPGLLTLIQDLKRAARENDAPIWRDLAKRLSRPAKSWAEVNLSRLQRFAAEKETVVIPGKLLGSGQITKKVRVAAFKRSRAAEEKVVAAGGQVLGLLDLVKDNPSGGNIRIMG